MNVLLAKWTRNFVGTRGIEAMVSFDGSVTSTAFPLYDCHGKMVATVARSGSAFTLGNVRTYDVWGSVRSGASTGGPRGRYVANLGHVVDDESGLIYMRARFYEPGSGRFISEDRAREGRNWATYCNDNPVCFSDESGNISELAYQAWAGLKNLLLISGAMILKVGFLAAAGAMILACYAITPEQIIEAEAACISAICAMTIGFTFLNAAGIGGNVMSLLVEIVMGGAIGYAIHIAAANAVKAGKGMAITAIVCLSTYMMACLAVLASSELEAQLDSGASRSY